MKKILTVIFFQLAVIGLALQYGYLHPLFCGTTASAIAFAETRIERDAHRLARLLGTSAENIVAAELVQFFDLRSNEVFRFSLTYQPRGGRYLIVNMSTGCGVEYQFSSILPPEPI